MPQAAGRQKGLMDEDSQKSEFSNFFTEKNASVTGVKTGWTVGIHIIAHQGRSQFSVLVYRRI